MSPDKKPQGEEYKTSKFAAIMIFVCFIGFFMAMILIDKYFLN